MADGFRKIAGLAGVDDCHQGLHLLVGEGTAEHAVFVLVGFVALYVFETVLHDRGMGHRHLGGRVAGHEQPCHVDVECAAELQDLFVAQGDLAAFGLGHGGYREAAAGRHLLQGQPALLACLADFRAHLQLACGNSVRSLGLGVGGASAWKNGFQDFIGCGLFQWAWHARHSNKLLRRDQTALGWRLRCMRTQPIRPSAISTKPM